MKTSAVLPALLMLVLCGPLAASASDCDNFFGQQCLIDLIRPACI